jgi:hypothetical protein
MPGEVVLKALRHVWLTLESLKVPAAVMGGIGLAAWKHVRATRDIDLLVSIRGHELATILRQLRAAEIRPKRDRPSTSLGQFDVIQLLYEPPDTFVDVQIDVLTSESEYHGKALERRVGMRLPDLDVQIAVLTCEDLILHKLLAGRIIDRADAAALLRANRESLDLRYLLRWVAHLDLTSQFDEIWNEALPGERMPSLDPPAADLE